MRAFKPTTWATASLSVTTTTGSAALTDEPTTADFQVRIYNAGTATVFIKAGASTVTAATTDLPVPSGAIEVLTVRGVTHIAGITSSGTATIYFTVGGGV